MDNVLPSNPHKLESLIGATEPVELEPLRAFTHYVAPDRLCDEDRTGRIHIPDGIRMAVLLRDAGRCRKRRIAAKRGMRHIMPYAKAGKTSESNLHTRCGRCSRT